MVSNKRRYPNRSLDSLSCISSGTIKQTKLFKHKGTASARSIERTVNIIVAADLLTELEDKIFTVGLHEDLPVVPDMTR